jgi:PAS domain S-box-containing protein
MVFILVTHLIDSCAAMQTVTFEAISDLSPDGIIFINNKGEIEYVNSAFSDVAGCSSIDLIGIDENALNSRLVDLCETGENQVLEKGVTAEGVVIQLARPQRRLISATARVIHNEEGLAQGKVLYFHDITHEQEADERIKSELLSAAAHKLRTPLVGILGFSELLSKREFDTAKQKEIAVTIHRQATSFKNMFDNFLDIEGLDVRKGRNFNFEKSTLEKLLMEVLASAKDISDQVKISFEQPDVWPEVSYDFDKLKQVFSNIISNAVKYSVDGSNVDVTTVRRSNNGYDEFGVRISDQGIGIAPSDLLRVGERFYRVGELPSVPGSGLGIAIARSITAIHGGRLELTSTKGQGTTVTVWLPVV